jgi:multidrug efflux pump subunit AcrA (membrane-fusion protein)
MATLQSIAPFLALIPLAVGIVGCNTREEQDPRTQADLVRIAIVEPAPEGDHAFTGVVTAPVQSDLRFRVPGKVTNRLADVGPGVRAGQPLMRIDLTDSAHVITAQTQNVEAAKAKAQQAAADEARYRGLVSRGGVSASTYDQIDDQINDQINDQIKATSDAEQAQRAAVEAQAQVTLV